MFVSDKHGLENRTLSYSIELAIDSHVLVIIGDGGFKLSIVHQYTNAIVQLLSSQSIIAFPTLFEAFHGSTQAIGSRQSEFQN